MIWSKLKKSVMTLCAASVKPHLQLYLTRYGPGFSHIMTRAWMTWDGTEIANFATIRWLVADLHYEGMYKTPHLPDDQFGILADATEHVYAQGIYSSDDFYNELAAYLTLPIDAALQSPQVILRSMALFDRRVGKRRLRAMQFDEAVAPLVRRCYQLRCRAEGIAPMIDAAAHGGTNG